MTCFGTDRSLAEREGFEPPALAGFRFQGGCIWPLCHRSGSEASEPQRRIRVSQSLGVARTLELPLADLVAQRFDPIIGFTPAGIGMLAGRVGVLTGSRVRPEELDLALLGTQ